MRASSQFLYHLLAEQLCGCFPTEAFAPRVVEAITNLFHVVIRR